ncbi:MAG: RES family NAD+ phosphorylase [Saprospiraceae bacterium]|nr:RES family NAD+ phosphorylase [Saprospiraceae bacterium]
MEVYRITREKYAADLTGEGARLYGGRWNRPGVAALYTSEARSLAILELLVHFNSAEALKMKYVFITLTLNEKMWRHWIGSTLKKEVPTSMMNLYGNLRMIFL